MSSIKATTGLALAATVLIAVQAVAIDTVCVKNITKNCADLQQVDTSRVCRQGANAMPCGDLIIASGSVSDVETLPPGGTGNAGPIQMPSGTAQAIIQRFRCNGSACQQSNLETVTCQARRATGGTPQNPAHDQPPQF